MQDRLTEEQIIRPIFWFGCMVMIGDALTTVYALSVLGSNGAESNPVMAWMIGAFGLVGAMILRALLGIGVMALLCFRFITGYTPKWMSKGVDVSSKWPFVRLVDTPKWKIRRAAIWSALFSLTITAIIVGNNVHVLRLIHAGAV